MFRKLMEQPRKVTFLTRLLVLLMAVATIAVLIAAPDAGYVDPDVYVKSFLGGPYMGICWVIMTGPNEALNAGVGLPADSANPSMGKIGTFCTHPKMAGGGDFGFTQYKNDQRAANPYLNAIVALSGMNTTYLSEMRYAIALGLSNNLIQTQSAYWAYLNYRRPDLFMVMESEPFEMNPMNMKRWFSSKPEHYPLLDAGISASQPPTGLFVGDKAGLTAYYDGPGNVGRAIPASIDALGTSDSAGPFSVGWDTSDTAFSAALAQLNYGIDGNQAPEFYVPTLNMRMYTEDPDDNPSAIPVGTVKLGQDFWVKYVGPDRANPSDPLSVTVASVNQMTTELLCDRFFYCYVAEYQYTVELKRETFGFSLGLECKGKNPPPLDRPGVIKDVTQWDKLTNGDPGDYADMITVPSGSDALYRMTISSPDGEPVIYKFGYRDLQVHEDEYTRSDVKLIYSLADLQSLHNNTTIKKAKLMNDILLPSGPTHAAWTSINLDGIIIDGDGHKIGGTDTAPAKLAATLFDTVNNNAALYNIQFEWIDVKYLPGRDGNTGALANEINNAELRNISIQGKLDVPYHQAAWRPGVGFIAGTIRNANISRVDVTADVTVLDTGDGWYTAGAVAGQISGTYINDLRVLSGSHIRSNRGDLYAFGDSADCTYHNIEVEKGVIVENTDDCAVIAGFGFVDSTTIERFSLEYEIKGNSPIRWFLGIGMLDRTANIKKGYVEIDTSKVALHPYGVATGGLFIGGTDAVANISECAFKVDIDASTNNDEDLMVSGIVAIENGTVNVTDCYYEGTLNSGSGKYVGGIAVRAHGEPDAASAVNISNCWTNATITGDADGHLSNVLSISAVNATGIVDNSYTFGGTLTGTNTRYIFCQNATGANNYRTVDSGAAPNLHNQANGEYISDITLCQGTATHMAGNGWSIGAQGSGTTWRAVSGDYPRLNDIGYQYVQVIYVADVHYNVTTGVRTEIPVADMRVYEDDTFKPLRNSAKVSAGDIYPQLHPQALAETTRAHIFLAGGSDSTFTFYVNSSHIKENPPSSTLAYPNGLPAGTYHNIVYLSPEHGHDWPGDSDDAWVEVGDKKARLGLVKMLKDNDYMTSLDGCTFTLTEYPDSTFTGSGTLKDTIQPVGMEGDVFDYDLKPGCGYVIEETGAPAGMNEMIGRKWYVTYDDTVRLYTVKTGSVLSGEITSILSTDTEVAGTTQTTTFSFKAVNEFDEEIPRGRLDVFKFNEDGGEEIAGGEPIIDDDGVTIGWTGAIFAVLRCNATTGGDEDFEGAYEAFGHNLICGDPAYGYIWLPPGKYILVELQAPEGYALDTTHCWITVDDNGLITIEDKHDPNIDQVNYMEDDQTLETVITGDGTASVTVKAMDKKPDYQLQLSKVKASDSTALAGVEFIVTGMDGTVFYEAVTTNAQGDAVIDFPQPNGTYVITEIAPDAYEPVPSIFVECVDGEMFLWGGPEGCAKGDIVIVTGGWVFSKAEIDETGVFEYTHVYDEPYDGMPEGEITLEDMGLERLENGVIARAHIKMTVENSPRVKGQLVLKKLVTGEDFNPDKEFSFTVTFSAPVTRNGAPFTTGTVMLRHGQSAVFTGITYGTAYTITEADYSGEGYTAAFDVPITNVPILVGSPAVTVTCTNDYEEIHLGDIEIEGEKVVEGDDAPDEDFEFTLIPWDIDLDQPATGPFAFVIEGDNPLTVETKKKSTGVDRYPFSFVVTGLEPGTYHFKIVETGGGLPGWTYDDERIVTVHVSASGTAAIAGGGSGGEMRFVPVTTGVYPLSGSTEFEYTNATVDGTFTYQMNNEPGRSTFMANCAEAGIPGPPIMWLEYLLDTGETPDPRASLAQALSYAGYGAKISDAAFNTIFQMSVSNTVRRDLMQCLIWLYEIDRKGLVPGINLTNESTWGSSTAIAQVRTWVLSSGGYSVVYQCVNTINAMMAAYETTPVSQPITTLAMHYNTGSGALTFAYDSYQPTVYNATLSWTGDATVTINGGPASSGVQVYTSDTIIVESYTGTVTFLLEDSVNRLKAGSIRGNILSHTLYCDAYCRANYHKTMMGVPVGDFLQNLIIGYAEFGTLEYELTIGGEGGSDDLTFTNTFAQPETEIIIKGEKVIDGDPPADETFTFTLTQVKNAGGDAYDGDGTPITRTTQITGAGQFAFPPFSFSEPGTYYFEVKETGGSAEFWTYDTTPRIIKVVVDEGGAAQALYSSGTVSWGDSVPPSVDINAIYEIAQGRKLRVASGGLGHINDGHLDVAYNTTIRDIATTDEYGAFYSHCGIPGRTPPYNQESVLFTLEPPSMAFLSAALASFEVSGLTSDEFNLLFGFSGDPPDTMYALSDLYRISLMTKLLWHHNDPTYGDFLGSDHPTQDQFKQGKAVLKELWSLYQSEGSLHYSLLYNHEAGTIVFSDISPALTHIKQKVKAEFPAGVTLTNGGVPVNSGDIIELSEGLTLVVSGNGDITFTDMVRTPKPGTLVGLLINYGGYQPMLSASCEFNPACIKTLKLLGGGADMNFRNRYAPETDIIIEGKKIIDGDPPAGKIFDFTLRELNTPIVDDFMTGTPTYRTAQASGEGTFQFLPKIVLTPGTYYYQVQETGGSAGGWTFDTQPRIITVVVDTGGNAEISIGGTSIYPRQDPGSYPVQDGAAYHSLRADQDDFEDEIGVDLQGSTTLFYLTGGSDSYWGITGDAFKSAPNDTDYQANVNIDHSEAALATALAGGFFGAGLDLQEYRDLFGYSAGNIPSDLSRMNYMRPIAQWLIDPAKCIGTPHPTVISRLTAMFDEYDPGGTGPITYLTASVAPDGTLSFGHTGWTPYNYMTTLEWDDPAITVTKGGVAQVSPLIVYTADTDIVLSYSGSGTAALTLKDTQNYLVNGSIKGHILVHSAPETYQDILTGYAEFVHLQCEIRLGQGADDLTFTNTYTSKKLLADFPIEVRKYLDGIDDVTGRVFTFRLEQVDEWGEPLDESECITVDPPDGLIRIGDMDEGADKEIDTYEEPGSGMKYGTYSFALDKDDLAAGTYYFKVYEVQDKDGYSDPDRWTYDARVYSVTVEVADTGGQLTATATFTLPEEEGPWEYAAFINTYETPSFPFSFTKIDRYGDAFGEGEAVFELYALDCTLEHDHDALVTAGTECWALLDTQATGEDGMVAFGMLGSGDYMLVEIKTRPGYQLPLGQWLVHVDSAAQEITITACGELLPPAFYVDEGVFVLTNYPSFVLPRAGSFSTLLFTAGGAALTGTAGLLGFRFLGKRRRRRK